MWDSRDGEKEGTWPRSCPDVVQRVEKSSGPLPLLYLSLSGQGPAGLPGGQDFSSVPVRGLNLLRC